MEIRCCDDFIKNYRKTPEKKTVNTTGRERKRTDSNPNSDEQTGDENADDIHHASPPPLRSERSLYRLQDSLNDFPSNETQRCSYLRTGITKTGA